MSELVPAYPSDKLITPSIVSNRRPANSLMRNIPFFKSATGEETEHDAEKPLWISGQYTYV